MRPTIARMVVYRSKTGKYVVPAVVSATQETLFRLGVEEGNLPDLSSPTHVHLTVFTPGIQGRVNSTTSAEELGRLQARSTPAGGSYQEWDVPYDETGEAPGSWSWPERV